MATNFPTNIDTFTDQTSSDLITSAKWNNLQDSIGALEEKVGADSSAVTTSHDYKLTELATTLGNVGKIKARAYQNSAQDIGPTPPTKILIDTISFDAEDVVNITNSRIVPNLPGYYIAIANIRVDSVPDGKMVIAAIVKNDVLVTYGTMVNQGAAGYSVSIAQDLVYMNGTTDYLELYAYNTHSSALRLHVGYSFQNYISILGPF